MTSISDRPAALPAGFTTRPLTVSDSRAVFELMAAQELHDTGEIAIEEADILADWQRPSYDVGAASVGVFDPSDRMVAYVELVGADRYDAAVLPDLRGRGIGTWLAGWIQAKARERSATIIGMPVPEGSDGDRLLTSLGYHVRWTSWVLGLPAGQQIAERSLPAGYVLRQATEDDHEQVWQVLEDAFLEWSERERDTIDDFAAGVWRRPGFEPWHLQVATDSTGAVVGVAFAWNTGEPDALDTYVDKLAVRADQRGLGLAQSLLVAAFAAGRERGAVTSSLSTDSRTGALSLYEKVGMRPTATWVHRAIRL